MGLCFLVSNHRPFIIFVSKAYGSGRLTSHEEWLGPRLTPKNIGRKNSRALFKSKIEHRRRQCALRCTELPSPPSFPIPAEIMLSGDIPPNQTIYVKNLNEKIKKEELKRSLYCLFSQYGRILDVVALKTPKLRGQAWVCFSEVTAASNAVRQMQNFPFYDKPMRIQYAKTKSDCIAKEEGSYVPREKKKKQEEKAERKRRAEEAQQSTVPNGTHGASNGGPTAAFRQGSGAQEAAAPNNILFIENLPHETTSRMLEMLFQQYPGFKEVRLIEAKPGIAFVDFEDEVQSSMAMQALQGFKITPQNPMVVNFAKK